MNLNQPSNVADHELQISQNGPDCAYQRLIESIKLMINSDKQHSALLIGFGGLYPCPEVVEALLAPRNNEAIRILDVGRSLPLI